MVCCLSSPPSTHHLSSRFPRKLLFDKVSWGRGRACGRSKKLHLINFVVNGTSVVLCWVLEVSVNVCVFEDDNVLNAIEKSVVDFG